ncbi:hypothetical protein [Domibacillus tundrae]|uniref:hypothetical protein n=1 Tax=Domibacillus tundrae TaxID=1587527 RepID=UPI003392AA1B
MFLHMKAVLTGADKGGGRAASLSMGQALSSSPPLCGRSDLSCHASPIGVFAARPLPVRLNETAMSGRSIFCSSGNGARVCSHVLGVCSTHTAYQDLLLLAAFLKDLVKPPGRRLLRDVQ